MYSKEEKNRIKSEITIGRILESDVAGISELIKSMDKSDPNEYKLRSKEPEYYHWMYFRNPVGNATVYCAKHKDRIVSTFAISPKKFIIENKIVIGGKTMDMFTDPNYQGMGLMSVLGERVFQDAKKAGVEFWYVTPSINSYPIFMKKWEYVEKFEIVYLTKILSFKLIFALMSKSRRFNKPIDTHIIENGKNKYKIEIGNNFQIEMLNIFDNETLALWNNIKTQYKLSIVKDTEYMNWRYIKNPDNYNIFGIRNRNKLVGIIVTKNTIRKGIKVGEIVDYLYDIKSPEILGKLFKSVYKYFKNEGFLLCQNWVFENSEMETDMKNLGLKIKRKKLKYLLSPKSTYKQIYDVNNWNLNQGDCNDI